MYAEHLIPTIFLSGRTGGNNLSTYKNRYCAMDKDTSVKVAVRIRPLSSEEQIHEPVLCLDTIPEESQVIRREMLTTGVPHIYT